MPIGSRSVALAAGLGFVLACARPVAAPPPAAPRRPAQKDLRVAPGVVSEVRVFPAVGSASVVGGLAQCGPGLIWAATPTDVLAVTEGITFPLLRDDEGQSRRATDMVCPAGGGLVVALSEGALAFSAEGLPFSATAMVKVPFRVPRLAPGVGDELWIWSEAPGELLHVRGPQMTSVATRETLVAVAGAAIDAAVLVTNGPVGSDAGSVVELVQVSASEQRAPVVTHLGAYEPTIIAVAVGAGGRVFVASEDEIWELASPGELRRIAWDVGGKLLAWGDHLAVLDVEREQLVILRLASPA